jgi:FAD/FMN-containing dehydrogenase
MTPEQYRARWQLGHDYPMVAPNYAKARYDWTQLFIGSEGTLGVITQVVIGLQPKPQGLQTALCAVSGFEDALAVLRGFQRAHPGRLLVFEAMWREFMTVATRICGLPAPFEAKHDVTLLIEADMGEDPGGTEIFSAILGDFYEQNLITDAVVAQSHADRSRFWAYRETPYEYGRFLPEEIRFDVSVPLGRISKAVEHLRKEMPQHWPEAVYVVFGHVADSNIHINVAMQNMDEGARKGIQGLVYGLVAGCGGSISAEHGIGRIKRPYLPLSRTEPELALMTMMKRMLDPAGILNPGRVI